MQHPLFPYKMRSSQEAILELIAKAMKGGSHVIVESGTGSGKTICALVPTLEYALPNNKKVLYLTRTNSQQRQVISELRQIAKKKPGLFGTGMQGRHSTCPRLKDDPSLAEGTPEELAKLCNDLKAKAVKGDGGCKYYAALCSCDQEALVNWAKEHIPTIEEHVAHCRELGLCPYEAAKLLIPHATLLTAPYIYFFDSGIAHTLLEWMNVALEDLIVIVDEAHNLPEYAREIMSSELSTYTLRAAEREAEGFGDAEMLPGTSCADVCRVLQGLVKRVVAEYVGDEDDGLVPPKEVEAALMEEFKATSLKLMGLWDQMVKYGEIVAEQKRKSGRLPRSYVRHVGLFMLDWMTIEEMEFVKLAVGGENPGLEIYSLDPATATRVLRDCHGSLHMSGTLSPMDEYRDSIGLPTETPIAKFPSPFPPENRSIIFATDVTTKFDEYSKDPEVMERIGTHLRGIASDVRRNTIFFFPSFSMLGQFGGLGRPFDRQVYMEQKGMTQGSLMEMVRKFKGSRGGLMYSVVGGRISEGLDFPESELEVAVLVGIPYPKPTAKQKALLHYYDVKFGKGWDYTVKAPTARKMLQSIGRLIQTETDRGVAVILDKRAVHFKGELEGLRESRDVVGDIREFFGK